MRKTQSKKRLILFLALLLCFFCGCSSGYIARIEDFSLNLSLEKSEIAENEQLTVSVSFCNRSSHTLKVTSSAPAGESFIYIYCFPEGTEPDMTVASVACKSVLKKDATIVKTEYLSDLSEGEYEILAYVGFWYKEEYIGLKTDVYTFKVV